MENQKQKLGEWRTEAHQARQEREDLEWVSLRYTHIRNLRNEKKNPSVRKLSNSCLFVNLANIYIHMHLYT